MPALANVFCIFPVEAIHQCGNGVCVHTFCHVEKAAGPALWQQALNALCRASVSDNGLDSTMLTSTDKKNIIK